MDSKTYLEVFADLKLKRSKMVKLIEKQIRILDKNNLDSGEFKWLAIDIAELEKEQGYPFLESEN